MWATFGKFVGKYLLKAGKWCIGNPEEILAIVTAVKEIKKEK